MKVIIVKNYEEMSMTAAAMINAQVRENPESVLGLATGGTPERTYELVIETNEKSHTDFTNVKTFNLDEYIGIPKTHPLSYYTYMNEKLFSHININKANTHLPSGEGDIKANGIKYDEDIKKAGGIDLQILGIGENAHIAFNEPGTSENSTTGEVKLTESTIKANSRYFDSIDLVPKTAISMGIASIMKAKKIILLASGANKANAIRATVEGTISELVPSSFLQKHPDVTIIVDEEAAKLLKQYRETAMCTVFK